MTESLGSCTHSQPQFKAMETAEADELVLENWKSQGTTSGMSVLEDHEILFPIVQVGTHCPRWITVKNPSQLPVLMQLILNSGEIVDECRGPDGFIQLSSSGSLVHSESNTPSKYGFSIAESALTEAYVHPYGRASFGPIFFHPSNRCEWRSSALIRNNLSGVEWLSLRGFGGSLSLVLLEGSELVQSIEFNFNLPVPFNISPSDVIFHMEETTYACSQQLSKELFAKNTGDLPLEVKSIEVSGTGCGLDGFMVHTSKGFSLEPGQSTKLLISYQADFSAAMVHRDLKLTLASGTLVIPMKASLPIYMLNLCKISVFWMRLKKFSIAFLVIMIFLVLYWLHPQAIALAACTDYLYKGEKSSSATKKSAGKPRVHCNRGTSKFSVAAGMNCWLGSVGKDGTLRQASVRKYLDGQGEAPRQGTTAQQVKSTIENNSPIYSSSDTREKRALPSMLSKSVAVENYDSAEASQSGKLTVKVGKEKGRRRGKRKGAGSLRTGIFEVSSSLSGNSTPSSPLSPVTSGTPSRAWSLSPDEDQVVQARNPFTQFTDRHFDKNQVSEPSSGQKIVEPEVYAKYCSNWYANVSTPEQPSAHRKTPGKPVLLPSSTFPCAGRSSPLTLFSSPLASRSSVAPHARAPGSKLYNQNTVEAKEKASGVGDEYTYNIWGDHFSGLFLKTKSKDITAMSSSATHSDSDSFFVRGPQTLVTNSHPRSVSFFHEVG
ncbi:hypothetical protein CFOL_v3_15959 [Cephalotus follicularis]|uniref:TMEM131L fifth Ig-like domain-containing protein n=1 Tax=Cephalotus follicularis TaxID=3775 RepID=A0A1Q3BX23_CEPFO|nr:hypothetical protein CFOL_v3_15959 [Cephalotus follicularis]